MTRSRRVHSLEQHRRRRRAEPLIPELVFELRSAGAVVRHLDDAGLESVNTTQGADIQITVDQGAIVLNGASTVTISSVTASNGTAML